MMKKATWKKLFTRNKSKTRDKNREVVCNLCVGMPLADVTTLCDRHRSLRATSGISQQNSAREAAVETQRPPSILKLATPSTVGKPAAEPSVEDSVPLQAANPEKTKAVRAADETPTKKDDMDTVEAHQDGAVANEEFMTEEVDSPNLSENSHTENTVPIVIEPQEPTEEVSEEKEPKVNQAVAYASVPSTSNSPMEEDEGAEETVTDMISDDQDRTVRGPRDYRGYIGSRKAKANLVWFGTENGPGKSSIGVETPDDEGNNASHDENSAQAADPSAEGANGASDESSEQSNVTPMPNVMNPNLAEPTPLSSLLPNVFLNAPLNPQTQVDSPSTQQIPRVPAGYEPNDEEYEDDDENADEGFDEDEEGYVSDAEESTEAHQADVAPVNQQKPPAMKPAAPGTQSTPENHQPNDGNAPRMVFGTLTSEFSAQPLFFSPNFGVQGMSPVIGSGSTQENMMGEESPYQNFSIFGVMKDFLQSSAFESQEGRVTEITEPSDSNRQPALQIEETPDHGQSPPSLDDEDESDRNAGTHDPVEKQLKKE